MVETCNQHNGNTQCKSMSHPICSKVAMKLPTTPSTASTHGHASSQHASTTNNIQHTHPWCEITYPQNLMFHHLSFFPPQFASIKTQPTFINPHSIHTNTRSNPNHYPWSLSQSLANNHHALTNNLQCSKRNSQKRNKVQLASHLATPTIPSLQNMNQPQHPPVNNINHLTPNQRQTNNQ
jgi:hypothetical protein